MCCKSKYKILVNTSSLDDSKFGELEKIFEWTSLQRKIIGRMAGVSDDFVPVFTGDKDEVSAATIQLARLNVSFKLQEHELVK